MKFSNKNFFSKSDKMRSFLHIWSHLLKKSWVKKFLCSEMSLNDLNEVNFQYFFLPVMHIQCKTWNMLRFLKRRDKCRKQKKRFLDHFYEAFMSRHLTPFNLRPKFCRKGNKVIKSHILNKFLEDSNFGSNFIDLRKLA